MTKKAFLFLIVGVIALSACNKEDIPKEPYYFTFYVKINKRITEPTIVNGYHGTLTDRNGKVKLKKDSIDANITPVAQNDIHLYDATHFDKIQEFAIESSGVTVYDLKKIKKADIKPKFVVTPNKSGFFQFDTGEIEYIPLIAVKGKKGYYPKGLTKLPALTGELIKIDLAIDYK